MDGTAQVREGVSIISNKIKKARKVMREAFEKDSDFKMTYIANIEMMLYAECGHEGHSNRVTNGVAEKILDRIFSE